VSIGIELVLNLIKPSFDEISNVESTENTCLISFVNNPCAFVNFVILVSKLLDKFKLIRFKPFFVPAQIYLPETVIDVMVFELNPSFFVICIMLSFCNIKIPPPFVPNTILSL